MEQKDKRIVISGELTEVQGQNAKQPNMRGKIVIWKGDKWKEEYPLAAWCRINKDGSLFITLSDTYLEKS